MFGQIAQLLFLFNEIHWSKYFREKGSLNLSSPSALWKSLNSMITQYTKYDRDCSFVWPACYGTISLNKILFWINEIHWLRDFSKDGSLNLSSPSALWKSLHSIITQNTKYERDCSFVHPAHHGTIILHKISFRIYENPLNWRF